MTTTTIPIIDFAPFLNKQSSESERLDIAKQIDDACRNYGFFHLINHGLSREQYDGIHAIAQRFFAQSEEDKQQHAVEGAFRGYMRRVNSKHGNHENSYETFSFYPSVQHFVNGKPTTAYEQIDANADILGPQNRFLDPEIKQAMLTYRAELIDIAVQLVKAIAMVHHGDITQFDWMREAFCGIRFSCYPTLDSKIVDEGGYSLSAHSDFGFLTLLNQDPNVSALEVFDDQAREWYKVDPIPYSLVINVGDMARLWSNGTYKAAVHRVIHLGNEMRYSIPLFYEPRFDAIMEPFPAFVNSTNHKSEYNPVRFGDYVLNRLKKFYNDENTNDSN
ncbi:hypothetical protein BDF22DRAFT_672224 [Syncephalis plumigaleata]|nr:hypothetical protein BDF22DRAFT_672224 [Syncephalis plumigaleata]